MYPSFKFRSLRYPNYPREGTVWKVDDRAIIAVATKTEHVCIAKGDTIMVLEPKEFPDWFDGYIDDAGMRRRDDERTWGSDRIVWVLYNGRVGWLFQIYFAAWQMIPVEFGKEG